MMKIAEGWIAFTEAGLLRPAAALLVFLLLLLFRNSLTRLIFSLVSKLAARSKAGIDISFFMALENPLKNFILLFWDLYCCNHPAPALALAALLHRSFSYTDRHIRGLGTL